MRSAVRHLAKVISGSRAVSARLIELSECPHCRSPYVHPTDCRVLPTGKVSMALRCPECHGEMRGTFSAERVRDFQRTLAGGRRELQSLYRRTVQRNMRMELEALSRSLELDLIGADDFGVARTPGTARV